MSSQVIDSSKPIYMAVAAPADGMTADIRLDLAQGGDYVSSPFFEFSIPRAAAESQADGIRIRAYPAPQDRSSAGWAAYIAKINAFEATLGGLTAFPLLGHGSGQQTVMFIDGCYGLVRITSVGSPGTCLAVFSTTSPNRAGPGALFNF